VPGRADWPLALRWTRLVVAGLFMLQLVGLMVWSSVLYHRFALTWDFETREQDAYLIAHGQFNPFINAHSAFGYPFLQNHGEYEMVLIGELSRVWGAPLLLLW